METGGAPSSVPMRVAIAGAGAMGSLFGAWFTRAGHDVIVLDVWEEHVDRINHAGLTVSGGAEETMFPLVAATRPPAGAAADAVFLFVKSYRTESALELVRPLIGPGTIGVSLQNGWGNGDALAAVLGPQRIVLGVTYMSAGLLGPGRIIHTATGKTILGPIEPVGAGDAARIGDLLSSSGFPVALSDDITSEIWRKLVVNASANPTGALTGLTSGELGEPGVVLDLVDAIAGEVVAVARAGGYDVELEPSLANLHAVLRNAGPTRPSMLQDFEAGRLSEIDVITGAVLRLADAHGIDAPLNRAMYALVRGAEKGRRLK